MNWTPTLCCKPSNSRLLRLINPSTTCSTGFASTFPGLFIRSRSRNDGKPGDGTVLELRRHWSLLLRPRVSGRCRSSQCAHAFPAPIRSGNSWLGVTELRHHFPERLAVHDSQVASSPAGDCAFGMGGPQCFLHDARIGCGHSV